MLPSKKELDKLSSTKGKLFISIYSPWDYQSPEAIKSNAIRIKNIISDIEKIFENHDQELGQSIKLSIPLRTFKAANLSFGTDKASQ